MATTEKCFRYPRSPPLFESIQRHATEYIPNDYTSNYKARLTSLGLIPLCYFKEFSDCVFLFHNFEVQDSHLPFRTPHATGACYPKGCRFLFKIWNNSPAEIRTITCRDNKITPFKTLLFRYSESLLRTCFDVDIDST